MREYSFYGWETADIKDVSGRRPRDNFGYSNFNRRKNYGE